MLQPLQLKDVSVRYANEIAELRDFLIKANCPVETAETLSGIAARLKSDRAFHRDLSSYIWVILDRCPGVSYSDLLGVLGIAAAGTKFAAMTEEDDAHRLLRFLMEARRSLDSMGDEGEVTSWAEVDTAHTSIEPGGSLIERHQEASPVPVKDARRESLFLEETENTDAARSRVGWVIAAGLVIVALCGGLWLKTRPALHGGNTQASIPRSVVESSSPSGPTGVSPSIARPSESGPTAVVHSSRDLKKSRRSLSSRAPSSHPTRTAATGISSRAMSTPPQPAARAPVSVPAPEPVPTASATARPSIPATTPAPVRTIGTVNTPAVGSVGATSSGRAGASSTSAGSQEQGDSIVRTSKAPIILRRRVPMSGEFPEDGAYIKPEASPVNNAAAGENRNGSAGSTVEGTIRITSLGVMAGSIVYSPLPTYPPAAYASHVQGEVKVMADVDRNGTVASARVISGPPLLRSAALDAIQRWRYRPLMSSGGPTPTTAIAVMDFRLP